MDTRPAALPTATQIERRDVILRHLEKADAAFLWASGADDETLWRWMSGGPFPDFASFEHLIEEQSQSADPWFLAVVSRASGEAIGYFALMRIEPKHRVIEVGHVLYTRALQKTRAATEAMYLLARYVFEELGYRRFEWKCNRLNEPSKTAALRLGFEFEGIFRQHMIIKRQNRDTAWFAMLDGDWPERKTRFERWLRAENFDEHGKQKTSL